MPNGAPTDFDLTYLRGASFPLGLCYFILGAIFLSQQTLFSCPKTLCGKGKFVVLGQQAHLRFFHASMTLCCIIRFSSFAAISVFEISGLLDSGIDSSGNNEVQEYTWQGKLFTNAFTVMFNMPDIITVCTYLLLVLIFAEVYQESRLHLFDSLDFRRKWLYGYIVLVMVFFGSQIILFVLLFSVDDSGGGLQLSVYLFVTACNIIVVIMFVAFSIYLSVTFSGYPYKGEIQRERLQKVGVVVNWWTAGRVLWGLTTLTSSSEPWLAMLPAWASPMVITGALVMSEVLPFSWVLYGNFYSMLAMDASQSYAGGAGESGALLWQPTTAEQTDIITSDDKSDRNSVDVEARYGDVSADNSEVVSRRHSGGGGTSQPSSATAKRDPLSRNSSSYSVASPGASGDMLLLPRGSGGGGSAADKDATISLPVRLLFQNDFDMRSVEQVVMEATNTLPSPVLQRFRVVCAKNNPYRGREVLMKKIAIPPTTSAAIKKEFVRRLLDIHTRLRNCKESRTRALFTPVHGFVLQAQSIVMVEDFEPEAITLFHFIMKSKNHGSSIDLAAMDGGGGGVSSDDDKNNNNGQQASRRSVAEQPLLDVVSEPLRHGGAAGNRWPLYKCIAVARDLMAGICQLHELKMYHGYFSVFSVTVNEVTEAVHLSDAGLAAVLHFAHHQLVYKQAFQKSLQERVGFVCPPEAGDQYGTHGGASHSDVFNFASVLLTLVLWQPLPRSVSNLPQLLSFVKEATPRIEALDTSATKLSSRLLLLLIRQCLSEGIDERLSPSTCLKRLDTIMKIQQKASFNNKRFQRKQQQQQQLLLLRTPAMSNSSGSSGENQSTNPASDSSEAEIEPGAQDDLSPQAIEL